MKKIILLVLLFMLILPISKLSAQGSKTYKHIFGINPLGLLFNIYSGHYSSILNDGDVEINVPFFYWKEPLYVKNLSLIGLGVKYRIYKDVDNRGVFYGAGISVFSLSWDYTTTESISATTFTPKGEIGYRINWENGFTLAPDLELGYTVGTVEASDGTKAGFGSAGLSWGIGFGAAWRF